MRYLKSIFFSVIILFSLICCSERSEMDVFVDDLLSRMTVEEKIGQMHQLAPGRAGMETEWLREAVRKGEIGTMLAPGEPALLNEVQRIAVEESRLGIPLIYAHDVIHGYKTVFPIPLGLAATFNPAIVEKGSEIAAMEARSAGMRWTFAPMVDVSRDPRWGRIAESFGEDPYMNAVMGVATVRGFQKDTTSEYLNVAACAKHFVGYGAAEGGKDYNTTHVTQDQLRDVYLAPFKALADEGVASFMCAFNDINGRPMSGNRPVAVDILRDEWGYDGVMVSDWGSIAQMVPHGYCTDLKDAAGRAVEGGVDIDMESRAYATHLKELLEEGKISEKDLDRSVRNILCMKWKLGLFENPYTEVGGEKFCLPSSLEASRETAVESAVLLKNDGMLPLQCKGRIAVVGPLADAPVEQLGTWCGRADEDAPVSAVEAVRAECAGKASVVFESGLTFSRDRSEKGIAKAVRAAESADVVLFFAGEERILSGEARCRADITLPGAQKEMMKALKKTGKPIVLVVMAGRPLAVAEEIEMADAVIYAFHGGTMAGPALSDLIFGKAVPSGRLPVCLPRMAGQIPVYYNRRNTGRPAHNIVMLDDIPIGARQSTLGHTSYYLDAGDGPLFTFGYGLSYTTFEYGPVTLSSSEITSGDVLKASCEVRNTGNADAYETVQLYVRDDVGSMTRPVRELKGFRKILIPAGESRKVEFTLTSEDLKYWNIGHGFIAEPGTFTLWIAPDSASGTGVNFELI